MQTNSRSRSGPAAAPALLALLALLIFGALPFPGRAEAPPRNLTLMIYLCGSDLESNHGSATAELEEITRACAGNPQVSVLALLGGSRSWKGNYDPGELLLMEIGSRGSRILQRFPSESMGKPEILSRLLQLGPELRPAAQYALILWDHGAGPLEGVCFDDLYGQDSLTLPELREALESSSFSGENRLSWIGFDACLMSSLEVACVCAEYADYMIASQEVEPVSGWNYGFLSSVGKETGAEEIGRNIVASYVEGKQETDMLTLALIRLDRIKALEAAADAFFARAGNQLDKSTFSALSRSRLRTRGFGRASTGSDYDLADLGSLAEQTASAAPEEARALREALAEAVAATSGNQSRAGGLSVYSPYYNQEMFSGKWQQQYARLGILPSYGRYLNRYGALWSGAQMADWSHLAGRASPPAADGSQTLELTLTEEQTDHFASASCLILEDHGSETVYHNTYVLEDLQPEGNTLRTAYSFEALYAVDERGIPQTDPIPFIVRDDYYLVYATLTSISTLELAVHPEAEKSQLVLLQCRKNEETRSLEILNIYPIGGEGALNLGRRSIVPDPETWPFIRFQGIPRSMVRREDGSLQPFLEWEMHYGLSIPLEGRTADGSAVPYFDWLKVWESKGVLPDGLHSPLEADNRRPWSLRFLPRNSTGKNLLAQFVIRDTQGNSWGSELIPLDSPDVTGISQVSCAAVSGDDYSLQPFEVKAIRNDAFQGICLRVAAENRGSDSLSLCFLCPIVNGTALPGNVQAATRRVLPGEKGIFDLLIPLEEASLRADPVLRSISILPSLILSENMEFEYVLLDRLSMETELDLSAFSFREPEEDFLAETSLDGISFRLISLEETEDAVLAGRLRIKNENDAPRRLSPVNYREDPDYVFLVNDLLLRDCLSFPPLIDLVPGGECTVDFRVRPQPDGTLTVAQEPPESPQQKLVQVMGCGYPFFISDRIGIIEESDDEPVYIRFRLPRPIFLKNRPPLVYSLDPSLQSAEGGLPEENPAASPTPVPSAPEAEAVQTPESAPDPWPFFSENVFMPLSPEQYAVTLSCPVRPEERDTVTTVSALLVFPRPFSDGIYDLQALVCSAPRLEGNTVAMDFSGLLPSLIYANQYFPCVVEEGDQAADIELLCDILIAGIPGAPQGERNQKVAGARLSVNLREGTARFTDYRMEKFYPSVAYEEAVIFYYFPVTFVPREDGSPMLTPLEDEEARKPEGHHFSGAPEIRMRPAADLKPDVLFRIGHQDGSFTLTSLPWDQAVSRKEAQGQ